MAFVFLDKKNVVIGIVVMAVIFSLGVIIGYFGKDDSGLSNSRAEKLVQDMTRNQFADEKAMIEEALKNVSTDNLRSYLQFLTKEPHIAGHRRDNELINWIYQSWTEMGLDRVELAEYDFYLSWPNQVSNRLEIKNPLFCGISNGSQKY